MIRFWVPLIAALLLAPAGARAQDAAAKKKAARLVDEGVAKYEAGDYTAALDKFQAAYSAYASPKIFLNLGEALRKLGRDVEAAEAYSRFLETPDLREEKKKIAQEGLAELTPKLGRLRVEAPQPGAKLTLDGKDFTPPADRPAWVLPGSHSIGAQAPGFVTRTQWVEVHAGEEKRVSLALEMAGGPEKTPQTQTQTQTQTGTPTRTETQTPTQTTPPVDTGTPSTQKGGHLWTWVAAGAAGAMLVVGILEGMAASSDYDEYKSLTCSGKPASDCPAIQARYDQLKNDIPGESTLANVMLIGAGVAAVGAGFLYWWEGREDSSHVAVTPTVGSSQVGVMLQGRF
jgi:hypothetical protein